jgi:hypothetical protein
MMLKLYLVNETFMGVSYAELNGQAGLSLVLTLSTLAKWRWQSKSNSKRMK